MEYEDENVYVRLVLFRIIGPSMYRDREMHASLLIQPIKNRPVKLRFDIQHYVDLKQIITNVKRYQLVQPSHFIHKRAPNDK